MLIESVNCWFRELPNDLMKPNKNWRRPVMLEKTRFEAVKILSEWVFFFSTARKKENSFSREKKMWFINYISLWLMECYWLVSFHVMNIEENVQLSTFVNKKKQYLVKEIQWLSMGDQRDSRIGQGDWTPILSWLMSCLVNSPTNFDLNRQTGNVRKE